MEPRQNIELDNFFIDMLRFSAPTPYNAAAEQSLSTYIHNSGQIIQVINSKGIIWRPVDSPNVQDSVYLWGARAMSRYVNTRYTRRLKYVAPALQNNIQPYTRESAIACITGIVESYRSISSWALLERYMLHLNLIYIELGIDFARLELPSLTQLIKYITSGRGSASRYLRLYVQPDRTYHYDKKLRTWNAPVDDKMYMELVRGGRATIYVGSRNLEFKIYKKHNKIRIELAVRGRAQILKFLNYPLSATPSRHITKLTDYGTIRYLSGCYLDRIAELFCGKIPAGACEAVDRALGTFRISPIPDEWTIHQVPKQELPPLPYGSPAKAAEEAFHIDTDRQGSLTLYVHNNAVLSLLHVHSVSLVFSVYTRIRSPPRLFPPVHSIIHALSATACMSGDLRVLLALSPYTRTREALTRATTGHGAAAISVNCTDAWTIYLPIYYLHVSLAY